jgi:hypothetical protein
MNKRFIITEEERQEIRKKYFFEQTESEDRKFCHKGNTKQLEEIMGEEDPEDYIEGIKLIDTIKGRDLNEIFIEFRLGNVLTKINDA